jgi:hypothetical protein
MFLVMLFFDLLRSGITLENALKDADFPGTVQSLKDIGYDRDNVWGYVEVRFGCPRQFLLIQSVSISIKFCGA